MITTKIDVATRDLLNKLVNKKRKETKSQGKTIAYTVDLLKDCKDKLGWVLYTVPLGPQKQSIEELFLKIANFLEPLGGDKK